MSRSNKIPFPRGRAAFHGDTKTLVDEPTALAHLEGQIVYLTDTAVATPEVRRSNTDVVAKVVRNDSGGVLYAGEACKWSTGYFGTRVVESSAAFNAVCGFVDDHIPAGGVQDNDLFYLIVDGPCTVATKASGTAHAGGNFTQGGLMYASSEAGHVEGFAASYGDLLNNGSDAVAITNSCGRVITTVANTSTTALIDVNVR